MSIPILPTVTEIKNRIVADLENKLNQTTPLLNKAFNRVLAGAIAGVIILLYQMILWTYRQIFPTTADIASLRLMGALVNVFPLEAEFAVLEVEIPGTNGYTVPETTLFRSSSNVVYKVQVATLISGGIATVNIKAQESGEIGNLANGTVLDIVQPDPNLTGIATVTDTITSGDDAETPESYSQRVISEYQKRKTGGSPADYEAWGLEAPNFIWVSPLDDPDTAGEVIVYGKVDNQTDGIPTGSQLQELDDYLNLDPDTGLRTRHPIGPATTTLAITRFEFDIEIFIQNGDAAIESDITEGVTEYVENQEPYNAAIHTIRKDTISNGGISSIANDIANPQGATVTDVILTQVSPTLIVPSYQLFGGEWGKVRNITFTVVV